ncbi:MAG: hypothetical protein LBK52_07755 [Deltaproteobacteria bacterium]|nr:hypothetical protein [Deltaproteobacteria bacterium]
MMKKCILCSLLFSALLVSCLAFPEPPKVNNIYLELQMGVTTPHDIASILGRPFYRSMGVSTDQAQEWLSFSIPSYTILHIRATLGDGTEFIARMFGGREFLRARFSNGKLDHFD